MRRRDFLTLGGAAAAFPRVALGQQARLPYIAFVWPMGLAPEIRAFYLQGLADYGYVDGKTIILSEFGAVPFNDLPAALREVVATRPDLLLVHGGPGAVAAKPATATIPIVFGSASDPVGLGVVASLAHPAGNLTGTSNVAPDLVGRQLAIMKEIIPAMSRIVGMSHPSNPSSPLITAAILSASQALGLEAVIVPFSDDQDFTLQFARVVQAMSHAVYIPADAYFSGNRDSLSDLQLKYRLPLLASSNNYPRALVGYGPVAGETARGTGAYVDAILRGAKPADLPVALPTKFDLVLNLTTAKAIGVTIPLSVLAQATTVIE